MLADVMVVPNQCVLQGWLGICGSGRQTVHKVTDIPDQVHFFIHFSFQKTANSFRNYHSRIFFCALPTDVANEVASRVGLDAIVVR